MASLTIYPHRLTIDPAPAREGTIPPADSGSRWLSHRASRCANLRRFLFLFIMAAAGHMTVLQLNMRRGHKFLMSGLMFGFCMARNATLVMRIVWACYPKNIRIGLAASILVTAGVLLLFLLNLIFAQRMLRAAHPHFGWRKSLSRTFVVLYALIIVSLIMVITATVQSFYTLNANTHRIDRDIQLTTATYLMFVAFLPIPMVLGGLVVPRKTRLEKFGTGRWRSKIQLLLATTVLLCLGAAFRCGTSWKTPRRRDDPAWYHAKWCFYIFNFTIEIIVVLLYLVLRVDRRFHIPNGSRGPGDYIAKGPAQEPQRPSSSHSDRGISTEEEIFDDKPPQNGSHVKHEEEGDYCKCEE